MAASALRNSAGSLSRAGESREAGAWMREVVALVRAGWLTALSYRVGMLLSLVALVVTVIPVYFVANALQPVMASRIAGETHQYFGFLLLGTMIIPFLNTAMGAVPGAVGGGIATGTLEALLTTPARLSAILAGLSGYAFLWTTLKAVLLLLAGWTLGAHVAWSNAFAALVILLLIILAYLPVGIASAAAVLAFRTAGPIAQGVLIGSILLGGVYYPTGVIPAWLQSLSAIVPLTYGLRSLRRTLLENAPLASVAGDIGILVLFIVVLSALSLAALSAALRYARRNGTLAQY